MIKKYFALSLISASLAVAGCSSDDDEDEDEMEMEMEMEEEEEITFAPVTPGVGNSVFDTIVNSGVHQNLEDAIIDAGLDAQLDDESAAYTVFAPTDAAFAALGDAVPTGDDLERVLLFHVLPGTSDSAAVTSAITDNGNEPIEVQTALEDATLTLSLSDTSPVGVAVQGVDLTAVDLTPGESVEPVGVVHVIDSVLTPPDAPEEEEMGEEENENPVSGEGGEVLTAMQNDADGFSKAIAALGGNTIKLDEDDASQDPWTIFAPTDAALGDADVTLGDMVFVGPRKLPADLIADTTVTTFNGSKTYAVGGTDEASLTIGGAPAILLGGGTSITYKLTAVPVAN